MSYLKNISFIEREILKLNLKLNRNVTLLKSLNELSDSIQHYQKTK